MKKSLALTILFLHGILSSPIVQSNGNVRNESSGMTDTEILDSFKLDWDREDASSPMDSYLDEESELVEEAAQEAEMAISESEELAPAQQPAADDFDQRIAEDRVFFEYISDLPGATLEETYRYFQDPSDYIPFLTDQDQRSLQATLQSKAFGQYNYMPEPFMMVGSSRIEFDHNWPQVSSARVPMIPATCHAYRLLIRAMIKAEVLKIRALLELNLVDFARPLYWAQKGHHLSWLTFYMGVPDAKMEIFQLLLTLTQQNMPILINMHGGSGFTPLHAAISMKKYGAIKPLLDAGADVNISYQAYGNAAMHSIMKNAAQLLPLIAAVGNTDLSYRNASGKDILDLIVDYRCVEAMDLFSRSNQAIPEVKLGVFFAMAFRQVPDFAKQCFERLLKFPPSEAIKIVLKNLYVSLVALDQYECVEMLLEEGVTPLNLYRNPQGGDSNILQIAIMLGKNNMIPLLISIGVSPLDTDPKGVNAMDTAVKQGNWEAVSILLRGPGARDAYKAVPAAILADKAEIIPVLLKFCGDLTFMEISGQPLWSYALEHSKIEVFKALLSGHNFYPFHHDHEGISIASIASGTPSPFQIAAKEYLNRALMMVVPK